jgi:poly(3-hydroxybutyrate) depolymerase
MSRPGTYGSSGDHSQRRRPAEAKIISAAIDALKKKYQIQELVITGQSGGGHVTASLITNSSR